MNYQVGDIPPDGILIQGDQDENWLKSLFADQKGLEFTFVSPIAYQFHLSRSGTVVSIAGSISLKVELACSRCLERFTLSLKPEFDISLFPASGQKLPLEVELKKNELDTESYDGEVIDLGAIIQNQIFLALPFYPLCRDDCKGLCPQCGINKNQETCQCSEKEFVDPRLSALKNFFKKQ